MTHRNRWQRSRRPAEDPGFAKFYTDRYGIAESAPNGYFTSCCAPLVYQDNLLPGLKGQLLACEPAQNLIHRSTIRRNNLRLELRRAKGEERSEFLTTTDSWFHPIALSHGPDGAVWITDFYREIIEDYSAIPRYLQQQYGLTNGADRGRIWRLVAEERKPTAAFDMSRLSPRELVAEIGSGNFWQRQTAQRLLTEGRMEDIAADLEALTRQSNEPAVVITAMHTLSGLGKVSPDLLVALLSHRNAGVRRCALQIAELYLNANSEVLNAALSLAGDSEPIVRLQLALALGAAADERVMPVLVRLSRESGADRWMSTAILSALAQRSGEMLTRLLREPAQLRKATAMLEPLCSAIAARREPSELSQLLVQIAATHDENLQVVCLNGIQSAFRESATVTVDDTAKQSVKVLSMMPADLIATLQPQHVADVIAWLRQPQDQIVLLDDNERLALALTEGDGTAEFTTSDKFSGAASLRVTPPQRYSSQIEGWDFRIREEPVAGEYRYIRFAWKSPDASGVMLELADDGGWPPAEKPLRRYFAGKNLSGWQAVEVASSQPQEWTVVTRDLWQDFGDLTLTGLAPTAMGGPALFDRVELLRALDSDNDR